MGLFLSEVLGGTELEKHPAIQKTAEVLRVLLSCQAQFVSPDDASLQIVFEFPGRVSQPTFEGIKSGKYSKKLNMLLIRVAVPASALTSDFLRYYHVTLHEAVSIGERSLKSKGIRFSLKDHLDLIDNSIGTVQSGT